MKQKQVGYFDIETADWTVFVVGGTLLNGQFKAVWHDSEAFVAGMFERPGVEWRAHNGGKFDFLLVLEWAQRQGYSIKATMRGASVLKAVIEDDIGRRITFVDTFALAPIRLEKFAKCAGKAQKGTFNYDDIVPGMDPNSPLGKQLQEYLYSDLQSLSDADNAWRGVIRDVSGVEASLTIGGTAWKSAAKYAAHCGEDIDVPMTEANYRDGRAGYFGGRVEVFRQYVSQAYTCDRNSSYPAALVNQPVPVGRRTWGRTLEGDGTVWARVKVPQYTLVPPLPVRVGIRLAFPVGEFDGVWTALELRNAVANHGVKVLKLYKSRMAERTTDALAGWCMRVWKAREEMTDWNPLLKLLANSLTGKLAQQPERQVLAYTHVSRMPAHAMPITPADKFGNVWFTHSKSQVSPCARPEWSAYLTSEARIELLAQLTSVGDSAAYCDTDSVFSAKPIVRNIGTDLGQWKDEGVITEFNAMGPKFYKYDKADGTKVSKAKGQSGLTREGFDALCAGEAWEQRAGANSIKAILRSAGVAAFTTKHTLKGRHIDDEWVGSRLRGKKHTMAPTLSQLVSRFG